MESRQSDAMQNDGNDKKMNRNREKYGQFL